MLNTRALPQQSGAAIVPGLGWLGEHTVRGSLLLTALAATTHYFNDAETIPHFILWIGTVLMGMTLVVTVRRQLYLLTVAIAYVLTVMLIGYLIITSGQSVPGGALSADVLIESVSSVALVVLLAAGCTMSFIALGTHPNEAPLRLSTASGRFCRRWVTASVIIATLLLLATVRGAPITQLPYPFGVGEPGTGIRDAGLEAIAQIALAFAFVMVTGAVRATEPRFWFYMAVFAVDVYYFRLLRGDRGSVVGFALCIGIWVHASVKRWYRAPLLVAVTAVLIVTVQLWPHVRWYSADVGVPAAVRSAFQEAKDDWLDLDLTRVQMFPQSFWHLLHTVDLYDSGNRQNGATYLGLIGQAVPVVLAEMFQYERPPNSSEELLEYRIHGGGFFVLAEAYWNFGFFGTLIFCAILAWALRLLEGWWRRVEYPLTIGYFAIAIFLVGGMGYGIQGLTRVAQLAVVAVLVAHMIFRHYNPRRSASQILHGTAR